VDGGWRRRELEREGIREILRKVKDGKAIGWNTGGSVEVWVKR